MGVDLDAVVGVIDARHAADLDELTDRSRGLLVVAFTRSIKVTR